MGGVYNTGGLSLSPQPSPVKERESEGKTAMLRGASLVRRSIGLFRDGGAGDLGDVLGGEDDFVEAWNGGELLDAFDCIFFVAA